MFSFIMCMTNAYYFSFFSWKGYEMRLLMCLIFPASTGVLFRSGIRNETGSARARAQHELGLYFYKNLWDRTGSGLIERMRILHLFMYRKNQNNFYLFILKTYLSLFKSFNAI